MPVAFTTAWYGLVDLAGARPGQKLLVHTAAGGVGMAAVAIARHLGLEVFGTASPAEWDILAAHGLDEAHVAPWRGAEFADKFLAATGGAGMDIVLNALPDELAGASRRLLPRGGAFIEIGQAAQIVEDGHEDQLEPILARIADLLAAGELAPLPVRAWDVRRAPEAFAVLHQARHPGKTVLTIPPDPAAPRPHGNALITGGTGMLGGLIAWHLADTGRAAALVLASRSARPLREWLPWPLPWPPGRPGAGGRV